VTYWHHQPINWIRAADQTRGFYIHFKTNLQSVAADYVSKPELQNDPTDWCLMDALVFAELDEVAEMVMSGKAFGTINLAWLTASSPLEKHSELKYYLFSPLFGLLGIVLRYLLVPALSVYMVSQG
jgi:hypothetical protein